MRRIALSIFADVRAPNGNRFADRLSGEVLDRLTLEHPQHVPGSCLPLIAELFAR